MPAPSHIPSLPPRPVVPIPLLPGAIVGPNRRIIPPSRAPQALFASRMSAVTPPQLPSPPPRTPSPQLPPPPPTEPPPPLPKANDEEDHEKLLLSLQRNGREHIRIDGLPTGKGVLNRSGMIGLKSEDVKEFFDGFDPELVGVYLLFYDCY